MTTFSSSRQGRSGARAAHGRPCDARLPGQRHRLAGDEPDLVFYASGDAQAIARLRPVLCGVLPPRLQSRRTSATAEDEVRRQPAGRDPQRGERRGDGARHEGRARSAQIFKLIPAGAGNSRVFELRAPMMAKGRYDDVTMRISTWQKDMKVIGEYARKVGCPTPLFSATKPSIARRCPAASAAGTRPRVRGAGRDGGGKATQTSCAL